MFSFLTSSKPAKPPKSDSIQRLIGCFGRYQLFVSAIIFLNKFPMSTHQMAVLFLAPKATWSCGELDNSPCPCSNPKYNKGLFTTTIVMDWNLICEKKGYVSVTQMLFQFGVLLGSVFFGMASDRFGRRKPLIVAVVMEFSMGVIAAFVNNYWLFSFIRLTIGMAVGGTMVIGFVIIMEFVGTEYRDILSAIYQIPFNIGHMCLPLLAYWFRDWRDLQLAISLPTGVLLSYFCLLPETPRWLIAVKKTDEAIKILEKVAKINNKSVELVKPAVDTYQAALAKNRQKKCTIVDLFRTPNLRKNILIMSYNWLCCSYCFYGVSQYVGSLSGDIFINVACSATMGLAASCVSIPLLHYIGRKTIVITFNFLNAFCLVILAIIPESTFSVVCACVGVISSFIVFVVVYLYCSDMFPTVVRNAAMGFSSMMARVGSMIAPFVIDLKITARWLPPLVFAIVPLIGALLTFLLPETKGCELMTTIDEGEAFGKKQKGEK